MRPYTLLIKPAGPDCNLACEYCFYTRKSALFGEGMHRMSEGVLSKMTRDYLKAGLAINMFSWQGGEPTLMGLSFFEKALEMQKAWRGKGQETSNALQTNGVLLDEDWCEFLSREDVLVGISLDGPEELHDYYRKDAGGAGTWGRVMAAIDRCREQEVMFNILVLVNDRNVKEPERVFDFLVDEGFEWLQFIPCIERDPATGERAAYTVGAEEFGRFMIRIFDKWLAYGPEKVSVRLFDSVMHYVLTGRHTNCTFQTRCGDYVVVEHNGDVYCCDFFVEERFKCGNVMEADLTELFKGKVKREFARLKRPRASACMVCRYRQICQGGCLKDRSALTDSFEERSYFCESYKLFYDHALAKLEDLAVKHVSEEG